MLIKQNHGFTIIHALLALILVGGLVFIGFEVKHTMAVAKEKQAYSEADVQITSFINDAAKLAPSQKEVKRYCSLTSAKFEEGQLQCTVAGSVKYEQTSIEKEVVEKDLDAKLSELPWEFAYDNTKDNVKNLSINYIRSIVYHSNNLTCSYHLMYMEDSSHTRVLISGEPTLEANISCYGSALKEYYK